MSKILTISRQKIAVRIAITTTTASTCPIPVAPLWSASLLHLVLATGKT